MSFGKNHRCCGPLKSIYREDGDNGSISREGHRLAMLCLRLEKILVGSMKESVKEK